MSSFRSVFRRLLGGFALAAALPLVSFAATAPVSGYQIVARFPHSTESYTEGFFYRDGLFYEGTGLKGHSALLVIQPETGQVLQRVDLPQQYFGEGIIDWGPATAPRRSASAILPRSRRPITSL
jgi:glutaminyl-peptide cyclotransferase